MAAADAVPAVQGVAAAAPVPIVQALDLTVAHGGRVVLHDIDFSIAPGEVFVILGASGSGTSSLLRDLIGLQRPARGRESPCPARSRRARTR